MQVFMILHVVAVDEWMKNPKDYEKFLEAEHKVEEEAPRFLQQGHFLGPLGNTMVVAISNALGLPIIVFSSASHYPVISVTPRVCTVSIPLYIALNHAGPGHYDAVSFKNYLSSPSNSSPSPQPPVQSNRCTCGKGDTHYSTTQRCIIMQFKYTTSIRCPCLSAGQRCTSLCTCHNFNNPQGVRPNNMSSRDRQRNEHAWHKANEKHHVRSSGAGKSSARPTYST